MGKTYTFNVQCKSGEWKEISFVAPNYYEARQMLAIFIESN
jgi:hypothetical protein